MTAADHANTVRDALEHPKTKWCSACEADALNDPCVCGEPDIREACAALDALQAQAEKAVWLEDELDECDKRADRAEADRDYFAKGTELLKAERDRLRERQIELEQQYQLCFTDKEAAEAERDELRKQVEWQAEELDAVEGVRDRLADAARVINGDGTGEFNTRTSALLALRAALAHTDTPEQWGARNYMIAPQPDSET